MMFNFQDFGKLMGELKNLSKKNKEIQEKLQKIEVEGYAGGDFVKVVATATGIIKSITISDELYYMNDKIMIQDLVVAAVNDALKKAKEKVIEETKSELGNIPLPPNFENFFKT